MLKSFAAPSIPAYSFFFLFLKGKITWLAFYSRNRCRDKKKVKRTRYRGPGITIIWEWERYRNTREEGSLFFIKVNSRGLIKLSNTATELMRGSKGGVCSPLLVLSGREAAMSQKNSLSLSRSLAQQDLFSSLFVWLFQVFVNALCKLSRREFFTLQLFTENRGEFFFEREKTFLKSPDTTRLRIHNRARIWQWADNIVLLLKY